MSTGKPTRLLSVTAVAEQLDCSRGHVYGLLNSGRLTGLSIAVGKRSKTRIKASEVEAFIEAAAQSRTA